MGKSLGTITDIESIQSVGIDCGSQGYTAKSNMNN